MIFKTCGLFLLPINDGWQLKISQQLGSENTNAEKYTE